ncbi:sulfotransferase family protein [Flavilitoribacter nigricans]|uniref:Sulfotransferase family protein n=1 Tax=Flavilitoribacter nigricans (strain ATCC 23147 / DSM 23189 / NBRC 102662 / NCIMB 1420 / SS-2) TaxID=1122177 RepID=A0A2D0MX41_FLAN2|nr:sulfotransferase [Flavilitoribacter nigricans]PHN00718.1 hypothetical protein CRP01_40760 [Flavilitoribacter nigricans DSM 23189 = NBRC 102662]
MRSPIIIVGAPRSGTSMMMSAMRHILGYAGHNEAHIFTLLDKLLQTTRDHCRSLSAGFDPTSNVLLFDPNLKIEEDLKQLFKQYLTQFYGDKPWFLKTPNRYAIQALPLMLELFPEARIIYMKRRGIENVLSQSRKFGNGKFSADYCTEWSACMLSFFTKDFSDRSLVIDQLAYIKCPDLLITKLLYFLEIDASAGLKGRLKKYLLGNPVEKTAALTSSYIALEETPWSEEEKATFLTICEGSMNLGGYPISRAQIDNFQADESFLFSGRNRRSVVKAINALTPWNLIPQDVLQPFQLHPNSIMEDKLSIFISLPVPPTGIRFSMLNPKLSGPGVTVRIEEINQRSQVIQLVQEINLRSLEVKQVQLRLVSSQPIVKIQIANEAGSQNYNYKLLEMQLLQSF